MTTINFLGIGNLMRLIYNARELDSPTLAEDINVILAGKREAITPKKENIDRFAWITGDNNPIHRSIEAARELGFLDTPLMGAHIAAYGEEFITGIGERINKFEMSLSQ